jgi:phage baseplate assembly protein V
MKPAAPSSATRSGLADLSVELGTIAEVSAETGDVRVLLADQALTGWLPLCTAGAGTVRVWVPAAIGEQVLVLCPDGELEAGAVVGRLFQTAFPAPANPSSALVVFADGAAIAYDFGAHHLTASLPGGRITVTAPEGVTINGSVAVVGDVAVTGKITATGDVVAAGKSLTMHRHTAVQAGAAVSGPPQ